MPSELPGIELARRAVAVLRNKVPGLEWYYFDVDLAKVESECSAILDELVPDGTGYKWQKSAVDPATLFSALLAALNDQPKAGERAFRRIFDLHDIPNKSGAMSGPLGWFNSGEQAKRTRHLRKLLRDKTCRQRVFVLAEGDSWFQFPSFGLWRLRMDAVRDILDHLIARDDICVESIAAGGDWLSNMLHSREYVDALSQTEPDVFLFSGGGNDLLGDGRAGNMVVHSRRALTCLDNDKPRARLFGQREDQYRCEPRLFAPERFKNGLRVLADEYFQFLNVVFVQYFLFLFNLRRSSRFKNMLIVSQGYDFAEPKAKSEACIFSRQRCVNGLTKSGKWLWIPFEKKGLNDSQKRDATYAMIVEFNELLASIARSGRFDPIAHIDSRGQARCEGDWYDEIHLTSSAFKRVAKLYVLCMRDWLDCGRCLSQVYDIRSQGIADTEWKDELPTRR